MPEINLPTAVKQDQIKTKVDSIDTRVININTKLDTVGKRLRARVFTSNGTFLVPPGVTEVYLTGGGGGGAGGSPSSTYQSANSGGTTSFGNLKSISGGRGGSSGGPEGFGGLSGGPGGSNGQSGAKLDVENKSGDGGNSGPYTGGYGAKKGTRSSPGQYCSGGGGTEAGDVAFCPGGGGGGDFIYDFPVTVTPGTTINVTIGSAGNSPYGGLANGGSGILTVKWWE